MTHPVKIPKKLIEVALPLDAINAAAAREKSIRHGHPSTLHLWWARRPLAAARAVIFSQLVNDPGYQQDKGFKYGVNKRDAAVERKRLFKILEELVKWESTTNEAVLEAARAEIRRSWREVCELNKDHPEAATLFNPEKMPGLHDPFAGGGTIPLEAQRLGLEAFASDLNPVAVLINKAMIEIPPKFAGRAPVGPVPKGEQQETARSWPGASGLAEDVRRYGAWMREEAEKRIGHLYPKVEVTAEMAKDRPDLKGLVGQKLTVIAWIWARTVKSPNPAFSHVDVPLASTFILGSKEGKSAYIEPVVEDGSYRFTVQTGELPSRAASGTKASTRGADFRCIMSNAPIDGEYIKSEGRAGRMSESLMAIVAEGKRTRVYLAPNKPTERLAASAHPGWTPDLKFAHNSRHLTPWAYGLSNFGSLFTQRQLVTLTTLSELIENTRNKIIGDISASETNRQIPTLDRSQPENYADAIVTYLSLAISRTADRGSTLCSWDSSPKMEALRNTFGRQALPMVWDFAEGNPFSESSGNWTNNVEWVSKSVEHLAAQGHGSVSQEDAQRQHISRDKFISTDPPYYDNVPYADLSDFFYVWLRHSLRQIYPQLFSTIAVPKAEELVADPFRHAGKDAAEFFFLHGMTAAMQRLADQAHPASPITIYYAFKQTETKADGATSSSGWETFLEAVNRAGLALTGTWPMRTELSNRMRSSDSNALASSIVLVCRKRPADAPTVSRREFLREINDVLPQALDEMTKGAGEDRSPVAPVDLSQAIIGPGMAVFSKYAAVLEADGTAMTVKTALRIINRFLAEDEFDADTQFCLHWFDQYAWNPGPFGEADVLARAKATSVDGLAEAGVIDRGGGKVRLLKYAEYPTDWDPRTDTRLPIWEALHHLIRVLRKDGESATGKVLSALLKTSEPIRQLAYRLYTICERRGAAEDARAYNDLVTAWPAIEAAAGETPVVPEREQLDLFGGGKKK
jgi:putative DNA methylase